MSIDGVSGFVGSYLIKDLHNNNLTIGCYDCTEELFNGYKYIKGDITDPEYLKTIINNSDVYFQIAALSSMDSALSLKDYILTNALSPYLSSRINKTMILVTISTIAVNDIDQSACNDWIDRFITYYENMQLNNISSSYLSKTLNNYMFYNPPPIIKEYQYYGFSKLLMEKLLEASSKTRTGKIFIFRSALVVGDGIHNRQGNAVVKSIMDTIFDYKNEYDVWNRINYYTSVQKMKEMILHVVRHDKQFSNYEILDVGWVEMNQHDFIKLIFKKIGHTLPCIKLVENSSFSRKVSMHVDDRVKNLYPTESDIEFGISEMINNYQNMRVIK